MKPDRLKELVKSLAENRLTEADYAELMAYIRTQADDEMILEAMSAIEEGKLADDGFGRGRRERLYAQIRRRMEQRRVPRSRAIGLRWAAAVLLLAGLVFLYQRSPITDESQIATGTASVAYSERVVPIAQRAQVEFPDGTVVWLNAGSTLRYPTDYMAHPREIYLEGEAYFDVKPLDGKPFVVHANGVATHVLGTSFNIQAYAKGKVDVSVLSGIVQVQHADRKLAKLERNQRVEYDVETAASRIVETATDQYVAWHRGELILDDIDMASVAEVLRRQYGIQVQFGQEAIANCRFTASFLENERLAQVISVIAEINKLKYTINGNIVTFTGEGC